jgi:hypothetical protein
MRLLLQSLRLLLDLFRLLLQLMLTRRHLVQEGMSFLRRQVPLLNLKVSSQVGSLSGRGGESQKEQKEENC